MRPGLLDAGELRFLLSSRLSAVEKGKKEPAGAHGHEEKDGRGLGSGV